MASNRSVLQERGPQISVPGRFGPLEAIRVNTRNWEIVFRSTGLDGPAGPEDSAPLSLVEPVGEESTEKLWKMIIDDVFAELKTEGELPEFVKGCEVTTGTDSTGDPAVYVKVLVAPRQAYPASTTSRWQEFSLLLRGRLNALRFLKRYPYIQFAEKRRGR